MNTRLDLELIRQTETLAKLSKAPKPMMETLCRLGICRLEIYDSKTVISTLQISAVENAEDMIGILNVPF